MGQMQELRTAASHVETESVASLSLKHVLEEIADRILNVRVFHAFYITNITMWPNVCGRLTMTLIM